MRHILDARGLAGTYDAVYVPRKSAKADNLGYAFVNFARPSYAALCISICSGICFGKASGHVPGGPRGGRRGIGRSGGRHTLLQRFPRFMSRVVPVAGQGLGVWRQDIARQPARPRFLLRWVSRRPRAPSSAAGAWPPSATQRLPRGRSTYASSRRMLALPPMRCAIPCTTLRRGQTPTRRAFGACSAPRARWSVGRSIPPRPLLPCWAIPSAAACEPRKQQRFEGRTWNPSRVRREEGLEGWSARTTEKSRKWPAFADIGPPSGSDPPIIISRGVPRALWPDPPHRGMSARPCSAQTRCSEKLVDLEVAISDTDQGEHWSDRLVTSQASPAMAGQVERA